MLLLSLGLLPALALLPVPSPTSSCRTAAAALPCSLSSDRLPGPTALTEIYRWGGQGPMTQQC